MSLISLSIAFNFSSLTPSFSSSLAAWSIGSLCSRTSCASSRVPRFGHVDRVGLLPVVYRAVTEIGQAHAAVFAVLVSERQARAERHLRPDDPMPAVETVLDAEHVHRATFALGNARLTAGQL